MPNPLRRGASPAAEIDIADFERLIGHPLPEDYRSFLIAHNGGVPRRCAFRYALSSGKARKASVVAFSPISAEGWDEVGCRPLPETWEAEGSDLVDGTIAVGAAETDVNAGTIRLGVVGEAAGRVFFRPDDTAKDRLYSVADGWAGFIDGLTHAEKPEPWDEPIEDGDTEALRAWLDRHRRKWDDGIGIVEIERKAVAENQAAILEMLVADYGFEPASIVDEALDAHRLDLAMHFVPTAASDAGRLRTALNRPGPFLWHAPALVEALLDAGADATDEGAGGSTPLHHAARAGSVEAVRLLLNRGADPSLADDEEQTPRLLAERAEWGEVAAVLRAAEADRAEVPEVGELRPFDLAGVHFARSGLPIGLDEILAVEAALKLSFPPEYRWLLTQANGAILRPGLLPPTVLPELYRSDEDEDDEDRDEDDDAEESAEDEGPEIRLDLYPLRQSDCPEDEPEFGDEEPSLNCSAQEMAGWYHDGSEIPRGFLPIGGLDGFGCDGSGFLLIGCRGPKRGLLFAFDHSSTPLNLTLPELFARLAEAGRRPKSAAEKLADAVEAEDIDAVKAALAGGAARTWMTRDGRIPLRAACEKGFDGAVQLIGEAGDRGQAITEALMANRVAVARRLFDGASRLKREPLETMLFYPAIYTDPEFLGLVIDRGVRLEKLFKHKHNASPMEVAAASGSVAGMKFLLDRGGKLDHVDHENGTTLLHNAVSDPQFDARPMIAFLLENGVPRDAGDERGHTALHAAIKSDNLEAAKALIDFGAEMSFRATRSSPLMDDPRTKKMLARAEKQLEKLAKEIDRDLPDPGLEDEDAPVIDLDDPDARSIIEAMEAAKQLQGAMQGMLPKVAEHLNRPSQSLGPPAVDLGQTCPYPHVQPLIEELIRHAAGRRGAS